MNNELRYAIAVIPTIYISVGAAGIGAGIAFGYLRGYDSDVFYGYTGAGIVTWIAGMLLLMFLLRKKIIRKFSDEQRN